MKRYLLVFLVACAGRSQQSNTATVSADVLQLDATGQAMWQKRADLASAEMAVAAFAEAAKKAPSAKRWVALSHAAYFLADSHYSLLDRTKDMNRMYLRGAEAGEQGITLSSPAFAQKIRDGVPVEEAINVVGKESVPAVYWYAANLGRWARLQSVAKLLFYKDKVHAYMQHCYDLDKRFYYGAPPRYLGALYALVPTYSEGDMQRSIDHFEESLKIAPAYLATRVLMAETYATKKPDSALYEKLLKEVADADVNALPELVPENTSEKEKAKRLDAAKTPR